MELLESMSKAAVSLQDSINVKRKELYYWLLLRERKRVGGAVIERTTTQN